MWVLTAHAQNSPLKTPCWRTATTIFQRDDCKTRNGAKFCTNKIVGEYDQEIPESQTADKPLCHREEEQHNNHEAPGRQKKQSKHLSLPHQDN